MKIVNFIERYQTDVIERIVASLRLLEKAEGLVLPDQPVFSSQPFD